MRTRPTQLSAFAMTDTRSMLNGFTSNYVRTRSIDPAFDALYAQVAAAPTQDEFEALCEQSVQEAYDFAQLGSQWPLPLTYAFKSSIDFTLPPNEYIRASEMKPA